MASSSASGAVFISYAREDTDAARRIADALRGFGVEVWFDQNELRGGDTWDAKIKKQIRECSLFIAVISATTEARGEGYFRREWKLAVERTHDMSASRAFLVPVVIDGTPEAGAEAPEEFMRVQWTRLAGGVPTPEFVVDVKRLLEGPGRPVQILPADGGSGVRMESRERGEAAPAPRAASGHGMAASEPRKRSPAALGVLAAVVAAALIGGYALVSKRANTGREGKTADSAPAASSAATAVTPPAPAAVAISDKSIAVLPFANMSDDKDTGFFADGVHEDLLTTLALVPDLKVVSRTSVMQYRNTTKTIRQIGEELEVAYVLEGSVRRSGNKVRVTGQLIDTRTDQHVWAKNYDRDLTDIFAIQTALSQEIAGALSAAISPQTLKLLDRKPTENVAAYDFYLKARSIRNNAPFSSTPALRAAEGLFKQAVETDPGFAAAWGELAVVHALNVFWGIDASSSRLEEADAAMAKAVRLAPDAPDVIRSLGTYAYYGYRDYTRATEQYQKLAQLQPNDPTVYSSLGLIQRRQGHWLESLANSRRALELDPASVTVTRNTLNTLVLIRRWDEARALAQRLLVLLPNNLREQFDAASLEHDATGTTKAGDELLAKLAPAERQSPVALYCRKQSAIAHRDYDEFKRLDRLQPSYEDADIPAVSAFVAGCFYRAEGDGAAVRARLAPFETKLRAQTEHEPANAVAWGLLGGVEALLGHKEEGLRLSLKSAAMVPTANDAVDGPIFQFFTALVYAINGEKDHAIEGLTQLLHEPSGFSVADFRTSPGLASLRGDPRFEALLNDPKNNQPLF